MRSAKRPLYEYQWIDWYVDSSTILDISAKRKNTLRRISIAKQRELKTKSAQSNNKKILFFFSLLPHLYSCPSKLLINVAAYIPVCTASYTKRLES